MSDSATTERELSPPDPTFWTRYSPRHECPIAVSTSTLVHALALGGVVLAGLAMSWRWYGDKTQPPEMSLVYIEGSGGNGRPTGGGGGGPKDGGVENVDTQPQSPQASAALPKPQSPLLVPMPTPSIDTTEVGDTVKPLTADNQGLAKLQADLARSVAANTAGKAGNGTPGRGGPGTGGGLGTGDGIGVGSGKGPGDGTGPAGGVTKALRAKILANRWHFDSSGSPRERIAKFAAVGVRLGFVDLAQHLYMVEDLRRQPYKFVPDSFKRYEETVTFGIGQQRADWAGLSRELRLPVIASTIVIIIPQDQEQRMADEEMRYAKEKGFELSRVEGTLFDFVVRQGVYEPVVKGQAPFDWKVPAGK